MLIVGMDKGYNSTMHIRLTGRQHGRGTEAS